MVWVFERTESLLIIILMHASLVISLATIDPLISSKELLLFILIRAAILWMVVAFLVRSKMFAKPIMMNGRE